jgi:hypothetical protein
LAVALILVGGALAFASDLGALFAKGSARGPHALAVAHGTTKKPTALFMKVKSRPRQTIVGNYLDDCGKNGTGGTKGDTFRGKTPVVVKLKHRVEHPDACRVNGAAELSTKGKIIVLLYARHAG